MKYFLIKCFVWFIAWEIPGCIDSVYSLAMNASGSMIVSGSTGNVLRVWDPRTGFQTMTLMGHTENIKALAISADGSHIISGSSDCAIKIWSVGQQQCIQTITVHSEGKTKSLAKSLLSDF